MKDYDKCYQCYHCFSGSPHSLMCCDECEKGEYFESIHPDEDGGNHE